MLDLATPLFTLISILLTACATASGPTPSQGDHATPTPSSEDVGSVTLHIFSGRPDPVWIMTPEQVSQFAALVTALEPIGSHVMPQHLGYRGLRVNVSELNSLLSPVLVAHGIVCQGEGGDAKYAADTTHAVERWLLTTGKRVLNADLFRHVMAEIDAA